MAVVFDDLEKAGDNKIPSLESIVVIHDTECG